MTLLDAPQYDAKRARLIRNVSIAVLVLLLVGGFLTFWFWTWPAEHRINNFMASVESGDLTKAYAQWNRDPDWQQHPDRYKNYDFNQFQKDWGVSSDYGKIKSHKVLMSKSVGNGTVVGLVINGDTAHPLFLRVDDKSKQIGFSPVELYVGP